MAYLTRKIDDYKVKVYGKRNRTFVTKDTIFGWKIGETQPKLICNFFDKESDVKLNGYDADLDRITLNFPAYKFERVLDLFRNEKPVYCHYYDVQNSGFICTDKEAIGEEES